MVRFGNEGASGGLCVASWESVSGGLSGIMRVIVAVSMITASSSSDSSSSSSSSEVSPVPDV